MGLFDALAEVVLAPVKIAATTTKMAVRATVKAVQLDGDGVLEAVENGIDESTEALSDIVDASDD